MKIRAITLGFNLPGPRVEDAPYRRAAEFLEHARARFTATGVEVQTTRAAGPDLAGALSGMEEPAFRRWAAESEEAARSAGISYLSLGRVPAARPDVVAEWVAPALAAGERVFLSADLLQGRRVSLEMAQACARAVRALAGSTELGFGNLRFAATASCPANIPFLPAAYHMGGEPRFSIAVEAADLALGALAQSGSVEQIEERLVAALEGAVAPVERLADELAEEAAVPFVGIDLSPAPYPADDRSIGAAIEAVGVDRFGAPGTLYVAALITRAIRRTRVRRIGFSGLMLPVLEDSVLARRAAERPSSLHELLLYSAVCGTGLDTVPLPGDISEGELAGIFLDVAALSVALDGKPLTARLLPVPGVAADELTTYSFEFFQNTRVLAAAEAGASGILARSR